MPDESNALLNHDSSCFSADTIIAGGTLRIKQAIPRPLFYDEASPDVKTLHLPQITIIIVNSK